MNTNIFTRMPKRGDLEVRRISDRKPFYIKGESLNVAELNESVYETVGPILARVGGKVLVAYKDNASYKWCERWFYKLAGAVLDGEEHSGVISIRSAADGWAANVDYTITYRNGNAAAFVEFLNSYFRSNEPFSTQNWYAEQDEDGDIILSHDYTAYQQASYNTAKGGFTFTAATLTEVSSLANIRRKHGGKGGEGAISNLSRATTYFRSDNASTTYNPTAVQTHIKTAYPVCLPAYLGPYDAETNPLGTKQNRSVEVCKVLRDKYGASEEGWLRYMKAQMAVQDCENGNMGQDFGKEMTKLLASKRYNTMSKTNEVLCKAAYYCYNTESPKGTVQKGDFWLPTVREVAKMMDGIEYDTTNNRNADAVNATLNKIGGKAISNGSIIWSCCRYGSNNAWCSYGSYGFFGYSSMCNTFLCVPTALHEI